jgi:superfamily II DNA or RNA helicase
MDDFKPEIKSKFQVYGDEFREFLEKEKENRATTLYDYQINAVLGTQNYFTTRGTSAPPALIVAPTGSGKSGVVAMLPYVLRSKKALILSPSLVITNQLAVTFGIVLPELSNRVTDSFYYKSHIYNDDKELKNFLEHGKVIRSTKEIGDMDTHNLVIVNAQKFGGVSNTSLVSEDEEVVENVRKTFESFTTIIVDEAHHYPAKTWYAIVDNFRNKQIVFLTATPHRSDGTPILGIDQQITYQIDKNDIRGKTIRECAFIERHIELPLENFGENEFKKLNEDINNILSEHDRQQPQVYHKAMVLVFKVETAITVARNLKKATYCTSDESTDRNKKIFDENNDTYRVLVVCGKLLEGYDNSNISLCVILRNVRSLITFTQFVGRCLRVSPGLNIDRVKAIVLSYSGFNQTEMWNKYQQIDDQIANNDPIEDE